VLIENSSRCDTNAAGQQVLPNDQAWLPALMTSVRATLPRDLLRKCLIFPLLVTEQCNAINRRCCPTWCATVSIMTAPRIFLQ